MKNYEKKPFPWNCSVCRQQAVYGATIDYVGTEYHDGHAYTVKIDGLKTPKCANCGQFMLDVEALDTITAAFMHQINLLTPEQIQAHRLKAKLAQNELAAALGVENYVVEGMEEGGMIQTRSLDNFMRLLFGLDNVREILTTHQIGTLSGTTPVPVP